MEINLSSRLRKKILEQCQEVLQSTEAHATLVECIKNKRIRIRAILKPARKQVMNMLTKGYDNVLELFRKTPMYQVSLEWRHRKQKEGSVRTISASLNVVEEGTDRG